jgi:hypothetical protein
VDNTCRDWLIYEQGIAEDRVRVVLNSVNLHLFRCRSPLPDRPKRALIFSNYASDHTHVPPVREACAQHGIAVDVAGEAACATVAKPEDLLCHYDLVFAKGRSAMEAMAVGTAVILCDYIGAGPMVTPDNFADLRTINFGRRALRFGLGVDNLAREIARYDARDAADVSTRFRSVGGLGAATDQILSLYDEVITEQKKIGDTPDLTTEERAAAAYIEWLTPYAQSYSSSFMMQLECERLRAECDRLRAECARTRAEPA